MTQGVNLSADSPYDQVISLGRGCQPAYQIRRLLGLASANIFDWIVTTDRGLVTSIADELEGFFARPNLEVGPEGCIIDRRTETQFLHEFPAGSDFLAQHAANADRFAMLTERWRNMLGSDQKILFVRQHGWDRDAPAAARRLRDTIRTKGPHLRFSLLYLTAPAPNESESDAAAADEAEWGEDGILNLPLAQPAPYDWRGDDAAWERVLHGALSARPACGPDAPALG